MMRALCVSNKFIGWVVSLFCTGLWRALTMIPIPTKYRGRGQVIEQVTFAASSPLNMHLLARKRWELEAIRLEGKILELLFWTKRNRKGSQLLFFSSFSNLRSLLKFGWVLCLFCKLNIAPQEDDDPEKNSRSWKNIDWEAAKVRNY